MPAKKDGEGHERVRLAAKRAYDPHESEWRNPRRVKSSYPMVSEVAMGGTRRELKHLSTSRKINQSEIPRVVASETGRA